MPKIRPFLKWAGSKYSRLESILSSFPAGSRLIEPFAGSGVVCINTDYPSYLLAENNRDLINLFTILQKKGESFIEDCRYYFNPEFNSESSYYAFRERFNQIPFNKERAMLFLYLNRHGYNGLCRYNSNGGYNVPFGRYQKLYFPEEEMRLFQKKFEQVQFIQADFRKTFAKAKKGDVIYCDPPYVPILKEGKFAYTKNRFTDEDQIALARLAEETADRGIPVLLSNHDLPFTRECYQRAKKVHSFFVQRLISCQGEKRLPVKELLAIL